MKFKDRFALGFMLLAPLCSLPCHSDVSSLSLADLNGEIGFVMHGESESHLLGRSHSKAGDVNGDGIDDFIIGAPGANGGGYNGAGRIYVIFGRTTRFNSLEDLSALDGSNGFAIDGVQGNPMNRGNSADFAGASVAGAGDFNNDGIDDLIIGAPNAYRNDLAGVGEAYIVFGQSTGFHSNLQLSALNGANGITLIGNQAWADTGKIVSAVGDINHDGIDDVAIGLTPIDQVDSRAHTAEQKYYRVAIVFGKTSPVGDTIDLGQLSEEDGFYIAGPNPFSYGLGGVTHAGDFNGDGIDDLAVALVRSSSVTEEVGKSYIIYGRESTFGNILELSAVTATSGLVLQGEDGSSISHAGDVNGDGLDDIIVGVPSANVNTQLDAGKSYVVYGRIGATTGILDLSALKATDGFTISGIQQSDHSGNAVSGIGDFNNDGLDDLAIGAYYASRNGNNFVGESYVVFGRKVSSSSNVNLEDLDSTRGIVLKGKNWGDYLGSSVSGMGDINADGIPDLAIGALSVSGIDSVPYSGTVYVVFGRRTESGLVCDLTDDGLYSFADLVMFHRACKVGTADWVCDLNANGGYSIADVLALHRSCKQ